MAKKLPKTIAEKYIESLHSAWPGLTSAETQDLTRYEKLASEGADLPPLHYFLAVGAMSRSGVAMEEISSRLQSGNRDEVCNPFEVELDMLWAKSRHVYRYDNTLSNELAEEGLPGKIPVEVLRMLPYPVMFVEAPTFLATDAVGRIEAKGFFCFIESWSGEEKLAFQYVLKNGEASYISFSLEGKETLADILAEIDELLVVSVEDENGCITTGGNLSADCLAHAINLVLYINSENADTETVYVPTGQTQKHKASQAEIVAVGARVGPALGEARVAYVADDAGLPATGKKKAPHIRRGHMHCYVGRHKDGTRTYTVKWQPPMSVGFGEVAETVVHEAGK